MTAAVEAALEKIAEIDGDLHAFAYVGAESARAAARAGRNGPLAGVLFAAKDVIDTHDMPTGYGSPIYTDARTPNADAACVAMARAAGAILIGKTVTTEFANLTPGPTRNPLDLARTPGGSSSGSAAAVAAGIVPMAYGTQTTQSTIRPASFCGVYGYCPSQGDFPLSGVREAAGSFDRLGLITDSLEMVALWRDVLLRREPKPLAASKPRIGLCRSHLWETFDPSLRSDIEAAAKTLEAAGAKIVEIELPKRFEGLAEAHRWISSYEFARNFAFEIENHWEEISERLRAGRIADGLSCDFERYRAAQDEAAHCRAMAPTILENVDVIITASAPGEAPIGLEATGSASVGALWTPLYLPCVTLPAFRGTAGMPMGLQVLAPYGQDDAMLAAASWIESHL